MANGRSMLRVGATAALIGLVALLTACGSGDTSLGKPAGSSLNGRTAGEAETAATTGAANETAGSILEATSGQAAVATDAAISTGTALDESDASTESVSVSDAAVAIGYNVGDHVPDFYIRLLDETKVESSELLDRGRPVFCYFFFTTS